MFKALIASTIGTFFIFICQLLIVPFLFVFGFNTAVVRPVNPPIEATPTRIMATTVSGTDSPFELTATQLINDATSTVIALTPTEETEQGTNLFDDRSTPQSETSEPTATPESSDSSDADEDDGSTNLFDQRATQQSDD